MLLSIEEMGAKLGEGMGSAKMFDQLTFDQMTLSFLFARVRKTLKKVARLKCPPMEQRALKNENNCLNTNIYSCLELKSIFKCCSFFQHQC
jgi:hypothetical protein